MSLFNAPATRDLIVGTRKYQAIAATKPVFGELRPPTGVEPSVVYRLWGSANHFACH